MLVPLIATFYLLAPGAAFSLTNPLKVPGRIIGKWFMRKPSTPEVVASASPATRHRRASSHVQPDPRPSLDPTVDPVVAATDRRIRLEALRQLDSLDLNDVHARIEPLWTLAPGIDTMNDDTGDNPDNFGFLDLPPSAPPRTTGSGSDSS